MIGMQFIQYRHMNYRYYDTTWKHYIRKLIYHNSFKKGNFSYIIRLLIIKFKFLNFLTLFVERRRNFDKKNTTVTLLDISVYAYCKWSDIQVGKKIFYTEGESAVWT